MTAKLEKRFAELSWQLIHWKLAYYNPEVLAPASLAKFDVSDTVYDKAEEEYLELCIILDRPNTLVHKGYLKFEDENGDPLYKGEGMFEVDFKRPSVHLILSKHGKENWQQFVPQGRLK